MKYTLLDEDTGKTYDVSFTMSNTVPITSVEDINKLSNDISGSNEDNLNDINSDNGSDKIINIESLYPTRFLNYIPSKSAACIMRFYNKSFDNHDDNNSNSGDNGNDNDSSSGVKPIIWRKNSFLIHTTGKVICPGKKNLEQINYNFVRFYGVMKHMKQNFYRYDPETLKIMPGYPRFLPMTRFFQKQSEISNIVITCIFPHELIKLNEIKRCYSEYSKYYPMKFPALDLKYLKFERFEFSVTYMIYSTGKILILGTTNKYQINLAFKELVDIISKTYKSSIYNEQDNAWMYTYFKYGMEDTKSSKKRRLENCVVPFENGGGSGGDDDDDRKNKKRKKNNPKKILTSKDRVNSWRYPQVYYTKEYGLRTIANQSGMKTLIPTDFIARSHQIYISNSGSKKYNKKNK